MNPIDQLIDMYMMKGMTEREAMNQVKKDALRGREQRKSEDDTNKDAKR